MALVSLTLMAILLSIGHVWSGDSLRVRSSLAKGILTTHQYAGTSYLLYVPTSAREDRPITVLVALGGMGDRAEDFAGNLVSTAESNGWLLVAPHFTYGDWKQIEAVKRETGSQFPWLKSLLDAIPEETSLQTRERILLYGFSRGGQSVHRFALMYPRRVLGVASMAAGTYTLPIACAPASENHAPLEFPLGVGDLDQYCGAPFDLEATSQVAFWVGVGAGDNVPGDVPRMWDRYIGSHREARARSFAQSVANIGARMELVVFPGLGHGESAESRASALAFLSGLEQE